jgi:crotonobetainyl-CoA:carnitine CoA-transferase CaiB-like acyl-CoA transferase
VHALVSGVQDVLKELVDERLEQQDMLLPRAASQQHRARQWEQLTAKYSTYFGTMKSLLVRYRKHGDGAAGMKREADAAATARTRRRKVRFATSAHGPTRCEGMDGRGRGATGL